MLTRRYSPELAYSAGAVAERHIQTERLLWLSRYSASCRYNKRSLSADSPCCRCGRNLASSGIG